MSSVESRIVTMKFDNTQFQKGVATTLASLSKLQFALTGLPSGKLNPLSSMANAANKFSLNNVSQQIAGVSAGFAAMATVAVTALSNITNRAVDAGIQMAKSLTIDPIKSGFDEYELKMGSIQTILSNTAKYGTKLPEVMKNLNELNEYADKTIYNFGDMTKNIGLFTNSGMRIGEATTAIKGFSNVAAASGTNAQGAASAAYQLSQAMSAGTIRLMDWRSLTNVGMGNKNMQEGIIDIADAMGELDKAGTSSTEVQSNFNASLEKNWLSADVMSNYLAIMAGEMSAAEMAALGLDKATIKTFQTNQKNAEDAATKVRTFTQLIGTMRESVGSGWASTFEIIFGDFNEATKLFTNINNAVSGFVGRTSEARNQMLRQWDKAGGRNAFIEGLANAAKALFSILKPIGQAFRTIFPATTGKQLADISKSFRDFTENLIASEGTMKNIRTIFTAVFGVIGLGVDIIQGIVRYFFEFIMLLSGGTGGILDLVASVASLINKFTEWMRAGDYIAKFFDFIIASRERVFAPIIAFFSDLLSAVAGFVTSGGNLFVDWLQSLSGLAQQAKDLAVAFGEMAGGKISAFFATLSVYAAYARDLAVAFGELAGGKIAAFFESLKPYASDARELAEAFGEIAQSKLSDFFENVQEGMSNLGPMLAGIGGAIKGAFGSLRGAAGGVSLGSIFDIGDETSAASAGVSGVKSALQETAGVADIVSSAWDKVVGAFQSVKDFVEPIFESVAAIFSGLKDRVVGFVQNLGFNEGLALVNTGFFIAMYTMLRGFLGKMSGVADALTGTLESASGVLDQVTSNLKTMQADVRANIILKIAGALALLAASLWILSKIPADRLADSMIAVAAMLAMMVAAIAALEKVVESTDSLKTSAGMVAMSAALVGLGLAMLAFAGAVSILGKMDGDELKQGLIATGLILAGVVAAAAVLQKTGGASQIVLAAAGLAILAAALMGFALAVKLYANIDADTLKEGGFKIAATIIAIGVAMRFMPPNMLALALGLTVLAGALFVMAGAMKVFGNFSVEEMAKSLIMLGGALGIIAVALQIMTGTLAGSAALLVMAAALAILTPSLILLGNLSWTELLISLAALAGIFTVLGLAGLILAPVVPVIMLLAQAIVVMGLGALAAGAGLLLFSAGLAALAVSGAAGIAVLTAAIIGIVQLFPLVMQQIGLGIIALAKVLSEAGPPLMRAFATVLISLLRAIEKATPQFGRTLITMINTGLRVIRATFPNFVRTAFDMLMAFLNGVNKNIGKIMPVATSIIVKFINGIANGLPRIIQAGVNLIMKFLNGIENAIRRNGPQMAQAALGIGDAIVDGVVRGIGNGISSVVNAAQNLARNALNAARDFLGINSPSKEFERLGMYSDQGLARGLSTYSKVVDKEAQNVAKSALSTMKSTMSGMSDVGLDASMRPVISPVLDLSSVQKDAKQIGTLVDGQSVKAGVSFDQAKAISAARLAVAEANAETPAQPAVREVSLTQINNSPKALSASEIYRNTRNQLSLAKEALNT